MSHASTIKTVCECDYFVYLDEKNEIVGFELSADERNAMDIRYHVEGDKKYPNIPKAAKFMLEIFSIATVVVWTMDEDTKKGELLFYKPNLHELAKDILKFKEDAVPITEEDIPFLTNSSPTIPAEPVKGSEGWLERYYLTDTWMQIWKKYPELQTQMVAYHNKRSNPTVTVRKG